MRQAGEVTYADAHKPRRNEGCVEFASERVSFFFSKKMIIIFLYIQLFENDNHNYSLKYIYIFFELTGYENRIG